MPHVLNWKRECNQITSLILLVARLSKPNFMSILFSFYFVPECSFSAVADVVFLVDGSSSVGRPNFKHIRNFISATAGAFQIGEEKSRVGVVQYSNNARTEFNLNRHLTRPALLRAIGSLPYKGGGTMTGTLFCSHPLNVWFLQFSFCYYYYDNFYYYNNYKYIFTKVNFLCIQFLKKSTLY